MYYQLHKVSSPLCEYCHIVENIYHVVCDCKEPTRVQYKDQMVQKAWELHMDQYKEDIQKQGSKDKVNWHPTEINYEDPYMYLFEGRWNEERRNIGLKHLINLVRISQSRQEY